MNIDYQRNHVFDIKLYVFSLTEYYAVSLNTIQAYRICDRPKSSQPKQSPRLVLSSLIFAVKV